MVYTHLYVAYKRTVCAIVEQTVLQIKKIIITSDTIWENLL